jgi:5-methylcytosine-specific restriction endonuclease McrA
MYSNCGTYAGYRKHHNHNTNPCSDCLAASSAYNRARYAKNNRKHHTAKYRAANLDKVRARERSKSRIRRAKMAKPYNELQVIAMYGGNCYLCNEQIDFLAPRKTGIEGWENGLHIDHLVPLAKGGVDTLENVKPAHAICNLKKAASILSL